MPKKMPPKEGRFAKGVSGNPGGRPKVPEDVAQARKLNKAEFERLLNVYIGKSPTEIQAVVKNANTPALDLMVCTIVIKAIKDGDHQRLTFLLDRLIGKVQQSVEVVTPQPFIIRKLNGDEVVLGAHVPTIPLPSGDDAA